MKAVLNSGKNTSRLGNCSRTQLYKYSTGICPVVIGGPVVITLAIGPKVREFKPGREQWTFKGDKNPQHDFLRRGNKAVGPAEVFFYGKLKIPEERQR
jgi:hypothetical protein